VRPCPAALHGLHLCPAAIHTHFRARDVATVVGGEKHHGLRDLIGCPKPAEWHTVGKHCKRRSPAPVDATRSCSPGVSMAPGLTAFTRMRRACMSVVQVRANARTAALVALYTLFAGKPLLATMDALRMIEAPSGSSGSAFCTVNRRPFTLMVKSVS